MILPISVVAFVGFSTTTAEAGSGSATVPVSVIREAAVASAGFVDQRHDSLSGEVTNYLASREGTAAVAVYDPSTGATWSSSEEQFETASIVKLAILEATVLRAQDEGRQLTKSERGLAIKMISISDNASATRLWEASGGQAGMDAFFGRIGALHTTTHSSWGLTRTTAADQLEVVKLFAYENDVLTNEGRGVVRDIVNTVVSSQHWGVSAGVNDREHVALKNGWLPRGTDGWVVNSIGHVSADGREYVIAALSSHNPSQKYGVATVEGLSQLAGSAVGRS
jgi:hypothetical protein